LKNTIINSFEEAIKKLVMIFNENKNDYFFTEKELHSYFYHLCLENGLSHQGYNLVHTEYPTPFKCETMDIDPYIQEANKDSKNQRAHLDLVLLNPNYIDYVLDERKKDYFKFLTGIGGKLFSIYIDEFYEFYKSFSLKFNESVLLYAIEFKYHRHSYSGEKYPARYLKQDINKLKLIKQFQITENIPFCQNIKSLVFIGDRISNHSKKSLLKIADDNKNICFVYDKKST